MEEYDLSNLNVLIVDENEHMRALIRTILIELGIKDVRDTSDSDVAMSLFRETTADIVFSDWVPGHNELKFLHQVRDQGTSPNPFVPIIVVSAYSEKPNVLSARDLGMTEFLATPLSVKKVYQRLCSVITDKRAFIKQDRFFGPDRRRHLSKEFRGEERRQQQEAAEAAGTTTAP